MQSADEPADLGRGDPRGVPGPVQAGLVEDLDASPGQPVGDDAGGAWAAGCGDHGPVPPGAQRLDEGFERGDRPDRQALGEVDGGGVGEQDPGQVLPVRRQPGQAGRDRGR